MCVQVTDESTHTHTPTPKHTHSHTHTREKAAEVSRTGFPSLTAALSEHMRTLLGTAAAVRAAGEAAATKGGAEKQSESEGLQSSYSSKEDIDQ